MVKESYTLYINRKKRKVLVEPDETLLWVLRDKLKLTGTKYGCGEGVCGSCSVLIDDVARRSCLIPVSSVAGGQKIVTIEGLARGGKLTPIQRAFINHTGFCCGFCTPGMIINATALLKQNSRPTRREILRAMENNLCRCSSYKNILEAIESVADSKATGGGY